MDVIIGIVKYTNKQGITNVLPFGFRNVVKEEAEQRITAEITAKGGIVLEVQLATTDSEVTKVVLGSYNNGNDAIVHGVVNMTDQKAEQFMREVILDTYGLDTGKIELYTADVR